MPTKRKQIRLPRPIAQKMKAEAARRGQSISSYGRSLVEKFLNEGSQRPIERDPDVVILMDEDDVARAEAKARSENDCTLRDVLIYEISRAQA